MSYLGVPPFGQTVRTVTTITATASQTSFTPTGGYTVGYCDVFYNGIKLVGGTDFTATDGLTVVLTAGATSGAVVEIITYGTVTITDAVRRSGDTFSGAVAINSTLAAGNTTITGNTTTTTLNSGNTAITGTATISGNVVLGTTTITANGGVGTAGQVLTSGATGNAYWSTVSTTLDSVLGSGNTTTKSLTTGPLTVNGAFTTSTNTATFGTAVYHVANGNVGIGTSTPSQQLQVNGAALIGNGGVNEYLYFDSTLAYVGRNASTGDVWLNSAGAQGVVLGVSGTEVARAGSAGYFLVGTNTTLPTYGSASLQVSGASGQGAATFRGTSSTAGYEVIQVWKTPTSGDNKLVAWLTDTGASERGNIYYNRAGNQIVYATTSDERLKKNIVDAPSALAKINAVKIRSFDWKETGNHVDFGVIAQEFINPFPEGVSKGMENEDGSIRSPWTASPAVLVPALTKAVQELSATVNALNARLEALENK